MITRPKWLSPGSCDAEGIIRLVGGNNNNTGEWRCAPVDFGEQCVMIRGMHS